MCKVEFLNQLRSQLAILKPDEVADIIEEYAQHIDRKISSGKSEEEATSDFGTISSLAKEILDAYHINPYSSDLEGDSPKSQKNEHHSFSSTSGNTQKAQKPSLFSVFMQKSPLILFFAAVEIILFIVVGFFLLIPFQIAKSIFLLPFVFLPYPLEHLATLSVQLLLYLLLGAGWLFLLADFIYKNYHRQEYVGLFFNIKQLSKNQTVLFPSFSGSAEKEVPHPNSTEEFFHSTANPERSVEFSSSSLDYKKLQGSIFTSGKILLKIILGFFTLFPLLLFLLSIASVGLFTATYFFNMTSFSLIILSVGSTLIFFGILGILIPFLFPKKHKQELTEVS